MNSDYSNDDCGQQPCKAMHNWLYDFLANYRPPLVNRVLMICLLSCTLGVFLDSCLHKPDLLTMLWKEGEVTEVLVCTLKWQQRMRIVLQYELDREFHWRQKEHAYNTAHFNLLLIYLKFPILLSLSYFHADHHPEIITYTKNRRQMNKITWCHTSMAVEMKMKERAWELCRGHSHASRGQGLPQKWSSEMSQISKIIEPARDTPRTYGQSDTRVPFHIQTTFHFLLVNVLLKITNTHALIPILTQSCVQAHTNACKHSCTCINIEVIHWKLHKHAPGIFFPGKK